MKSNKKNPVVKIRLVGEADKIKQLINSIDSTIEIIHESKPYTVRNGHGVRVYIDVLIHD